LCDSRALQLIIACLRFIIRSQGLKYSDHTSISFAAERPSHLFETQNNGEAQYAL